MSTIRHIRIEVLGVTQKRLAEIAGASQPTVCRWEAGTDHPDLNHLRRIADAVREAGHEFDERKFFEMPEAAE